MEEREGAIKACISEIRDHVPVGHMLFFSGTQAETDIGYKLLKQDECGIGVTHYWREGYVDILGLDTEEVKEVAETLWGYGYYMIPCCGGEYINKPVWWREI